MEEELFPNPHIYVADWLMSSLYLPLVASITTTDPTMVWNDMVNAHVNSNMRSSEKS